MNLATPATFQGALYASVVERFASHVTLYQDTCPGLVQQIEKGELDGTATTDGAAARVTTSTPGPKAALRLRKTAAWARVAVRLGLKMSPNLSEYPTVMLSLYSRSIDAQ